MRSRENADHLPGVESRRSTAGRSLLFRGDHDGDEISGPASEVLAGETIIRGLAGTITSTPAAITVTLQRPGAPRITRALALLLDEINATPPAIPGDTRPITYQLAPQAGI